MKKTSSDHEEKVQPEEDNDEVKQIEKAIRT